MTGDRKGFQQFRYQQTGGAEPRPAIGLTFQHHDLIAGLAQDPGTGEAGEPGADNDNIQHLHRDPLN